MSLALFYLMASDRDWSYTSRMRYAKRPRRGNEAPAQVMSEADLRERVAERLHVRNNEMELQAASRTFVDMMKFDAARADVYLSLMQAESLLQLLFNTDCVIDMASSADRDASLLEFVRSYDANAAQLIDAIKHYESTGRILNLGHWLKTLLPREPLPKSPPNLRGSVAAAAQQQRVTRGSASSSQLIPRGSVASVLAGASASSDVCLI